MIGKYFAQARFYDSTQGRMLSKDPIKRGLNPYPYCDNDPVDYVDPTGEVANILIGGGIGGLIGGVSGFASSAVSQLTSGQGFSMKKALGSAANGAVVGAVQGALVSSGAGLVTSLISNFAAGTAGNALEQGISTGRVNVAESIASGATNAVSNLIYGTKPLQSAKSAFLRGTGAGAATGAINNISSAIGFRDTASGNGIGAGLASAMTTGMTIPYVKVRNPRTICEVSNPFESRCGYQNTYGYQYEVCPISVDKNANSKNRGFNLGSFIKDVAIGAVTGGLSSVAFHGAGKAVDVLKDGVWNRGVGSRRSSNAGIPLNNIEGESREINYSNIIHALRESNSIEGDTVAKLLKKGKITVKIKDYHFDGRGGSYFPKSRNIIIYRKIKLPNGKWIMQTPNLAAGYLAHETKHWIDGNVSTKMHEFVAYVWQRKVDRMVKYTDEEIWNTINTHPAYKHLKD